MNKPHMRFHLSEARQALDQLISELDGDPEYEIGDYRVDIEHVYHHINSAWNGRDASAAAVDACAQEDFERWRAFPTDIELTSRANHLTRRCSEPLAAPRFHFR